jgi:hypothetical protein
MSQLVELLNTQQKNVPNFQSMICLSQFAFEMFIPIIGSP